MDYFISDLHFGHAKALIYDNSPFETIEERDQVIINNWNSVVTDEDTVWILGDLTWKKPSEIIKLLNELNGRKKLIHGNHDGRLLKNKSFRDMFDEITSYRELDIGDELVVLCHYPIPLFRGHYNGAYHLYGHVHCTAEWEFTEKIRKELEESGIKCNMFNVGCMAPCMDYTPRTFKEIKQFISERSVYKAPEETTNTEETR